jgi:hypothetical protein
MAKLKKGDKDAATADLDAAKALKPDVAKDYAKYGVR